LWASKFKKIKTMQLSVQHMNPQDQMLTCSKNLLTQLQEEHKGRISEVVQIWNGYDSKFSFKISGFSIDGTLSVKKDKLEISGKLPFGARLFKGMIEDTILKNMRELVQNCKKRSV